MENTEHCEWFEFLLSSNICVFQNGLDRFFGKKSFQFNLGENISVDSDVGDVVIGGILMLVAKSW